MFCTFCGAQNPDGVEYCASCGKQIGRTTAVTPKVNSIPFFRQYGGWIAAVGGGLTLLGFITPWVSVNIHNFVSGSYSALTGFFALIFSVFTSILSALSSYDGLNPVGVWMAIFSILMTIPCVLILLYGIFNLRDGLRINKLSKTDTATLAGYGRAMKKRSTTCLVFLGIYFLFALLLSSFRTNGMLGELFGSLVGGTYFGIGFWLTTIGYILVLVLGINLIPADEKPLD